jgi:DNA-binding NarL/FixJ family response regulator
MASKRKASVAATVVGKWTRAEDKILREKVKTLKQYEIGELLGRTESSVKHRICKLGLYNGRFERRRWTMKEDALVMELAEKEKFVVIGYLLNRTMASVRARYHKLYQYKKEQK